MTILTAANTLRDFANDPQTRRAHGHRWSKYDDNGWHTTDLTLSIMARIARQLDLDIYNDQVADELYWICCHLESWPEGEGFGSSDSYGEYCHALRVFHVTPIKERELRSKVR